MDGVEVWERVRRYANECLADNKSIFTSERQVRNFISDVKPASIGRRSDNATTSSSRVTRGDVLGLWTQVNGGPKADVPYFTRALMVASLPELVELVGSTLRLRGGSQQPQGHPAPTAARPNLRVALVVSEVLSEKKTCEGRFPKRSLQTLINEGVELVAFPEMFRECDSRDEVVPTVRALAEELNVPVLAGVWCVDEQMQCAGYWNPRPRDGETREHFYAKHCTSVRLAYELADYDQIRDSMFAPIQLGGRKFGVLLCHDMFFGLVGARWREQGADAMIDLTGSNVNLAKWTNVVAGRSLEQDAPFLCTMAHWAFQESGAARAFGYRAGLPMRPSNTVHTEREGSVVVFELEGPVEAAEPPEQAFTEKAYRGIRVALNAAAAKAHIHVALDATADGSPVPNAPGWHGYKIGAARVGLLVLPLSRLRDALAIHKAEPPASPFAHHIVVFVGGDGEIDAALALSLARLRAIEHRMAIGILTPSTCEMLKTNRYKNIQRFHHEGGVFGLDMMFLGGTHASAPTSGANGIRKEFLDAYHALMETEEESRARRWAHGDIVTASYNGEVYDPVRVIRPDSWGWMIVHWGVDDSFSSIRTADILGRSSERWERDEHAEDVEIDF